MMVEVNLTQDQRKMYNVAAHVWYVHVYFLIISYLAKLPLNRESLRISVESIRHTDTHRQTHRHTQTDRC